MTAIVTNKFRFNAAEKFVEDVSENNYYIFVGRSEKWVSDAQPDDPYDNDYSAYTDAWNRAMALKKISALDIAYVAPRYQWISGTTYAEYDDRDPNLEGKPYYVISDNNNVYICLKSGGISTKNPDIAGLTTNGVIDYSANDGYIWKYLYTVSTDASNRFLTSAFIPVTHVTTNPVDGEDTAITNQRNVQDNAINGAIYNIKVLNGGTGYVTAPSIQIVGNGQNATATATVSGGVITEITITNPGQGYDYAKVVVSGGQGSGGSAYAILGPTGGFGFNPRQELRAHYVGINMSLVYNDGSGDFIVGNDFRQIGIVKNPLLQNGNLATTDTLKATKELEVGLGYSFAADDVIQGTVTGATAIVDSYENGIIRYHQSEETSFDYFDEAIGDYIRRINDTSSSGVPLIQQFQSEVKTHTGEIIFLENRTPINRASDQIETIKLVLEF